MIVFNDMIADIHCNKKPSLTVTELFLRGKKLNISYIFYHAIILNDVRLNTTSFVTMKILNKRELQQITFNHSSGIEFNFMNNYKK